MVPSGDHAGFTSKASLSVSCFGRERTVTVKSWLAVSPPGSRAATVAGALPSAMAVTVTVPPFTDTVATAGFDDVAV